MSDATLDSWYVPEAAYPREESSEEQLRFLLRYAVLAPSSRNAQPWLFSVRGDTVELYADRTRSLPVADPGDRELTIACGASLFYLRLAMRYFGNADVVEAFPEPDDPDLLARVRMGAPARPHDEDVLLFAAIPKRHTNRSAFEAKKIPEALQSGLEAAAQAEGSWLHIVRDVDTQYVLADLIAEADHIQWGNESFRSEFAAWVQPNSHPGHDGIPGYALGMEDQESKIAPLIMESFDVSRQMSNKDYKLALAAPALVVLGTEEDSPEGWLTAGQALACVLLRATAGGLSAAFFNQPVEVPKMRPILSEVLATEGYPQIVFRLGYGPKVKPTPRRTVDDVTF